jgi:hypothetical protein
VVMASLGAVDRGSEPHRLYLEVTGEMKRIAAVLPRATAHPHIPAQRAQERPEPEVSTTSHSAGEAATARAVSRTSERRPDEPSRRLQAVAAVFVAVYVIVGAYAAVDLAGEGATDTPVAPSSSR